MQKRKSHTKSRNGCRNCKKRHVKCDEQGPPCLQCVLRKETATCALPIIRKAAAPAALARPSAALSPSPSSFSSATEGDRLLELELMHRWSTRSWLCQASTPECQPYLLGRLPRAALGNSYLLNAIFATAALDLSLSSADNQALSASGTYIRAVQDYASKAITEFRTQVTTLTRENVDLVFYFSSMVGVVNFSMSAYRDTGITDRVCDYAHMALSSNRIVIENFELLMASSSPLSTVVSDFGIDLSLLDALDPDTKAALALLSSVSKQVRITATSSTLTAMPTGAVSTEEASPETGGEQVGVEPGTPLASNVYTYQLAIGQTKYCFAEDLAGRLKGYFHTVFAVAGTPFVNALRDREPMALFIFLYWGVLVHRATKDPALWALVSEGQYVVSETSKLLLSSDIWAVPGVREGIAWARSQVDLPALPECLLPVELERSGIVDNVTPESMEVWRKAVDV
ncbi:hypothetical protein QBC34DRAFT_59037 [Podospora aff. communis PSN243]|uniref:Zn(2)-C6 fungal-type domain-containing protein n=1 Tax=Podospora aff. communis PSN243 TaxID=3040156 RepID=A0AAV9GSJ9_9PEZI|nr:hypothetical protein QBC34DRAFT_59037 [Podospora aff. communis PSN243]